MLSKASSGSEVGRSGSRTILLSGVVLNWLGALGIAREVWPAKPDSDAAPDGEHFTAFAAGTAATFGSYYLYLYAARKPAYPWLVFGAALKTWAFVLSVILRRERRIGSKAFREFGVSNGIVGGLFWALIASEVRSERDRG